MREGLKKDVGFESGERIEKMGGMGEVGKLFVEEGRIVISGFMCALGEEREEVGEVVEAGEFNEV